MVTTRMATATTLSRDGRFIAFSEAGPDAARTGQDLWYASLDSVATPQLFLESDGSQGDPRFSPDGRFLAYQSAASGARYEVFVKPFPQGEGRWQVSTSGGIAPRWSRRGDRLYYLEPGTPFKAMEVEVANTAPFTLGPPRVIFELSKIGAVNLSGWDVSADGLRFLMVREAANAQRLPATLTIVQNWFAEFKGAK
jgi:hypothetical protein